MTDPTPLDLAHAAMEASPEDDALRLAFYEILADVELFLILSGDAEGDDHPAVYALEDGQFVLVFDREERLAEFTDAVTPYAALPGRSVIRMLAGQGTGVGLNLGVAPSAFLMPADAVDWLSETLANAPAAVNARPTDISAPVGLPERLLITLDRKLARAAGLARHAWLASVVFDTGGRGHLLAFVDAEVGAEDTLARAVGEALTFSGIEAGALDIAFFDRSDPMVARLARHGLRFDLPEPEPAATAPSAPGTDPSRPPKLR